MNKSPRFYVIRVGRGFDVGRLPVALLDPLPDGVVVDGLLEFRPRPLEGLVAELELAGVRLRQRVAAADAEAADAAERPEEEDPARDYARSRTTQLFSRNICPDPVNAT